MCEQQLGRQAYTVDPSAWSEMRRFAEQALAAVANDRRLAVWSALLHCVERLSQRTGRPAVDRVASVLDWLHAHATERVRLGELAQQAGVSQRTFFIRFHERFGCSLSVWQRRERTRAMCRLLAQGTAVLDAAIAAGYGDLSTRIVNFTAKSAVRLGLGLANMPHITAWDKPLVQVTYAVIPYTRSRRRPTGQSQIG